MPPSKKLKHWRFRVKAPRERALLEAAAKVGGFTIEQLLGARAHRSLVRVRAAVAFILRGEPFSMSFPEIGYLLGRDHSTIVHHIQTTCRREATLRITVDIRAEWQRSQDTPPAPMAAAQGQPAT